MALLRFLKRTFKEFSTDKVGQMSAAFAYMAIFSIGPLLLVLISVVGLIFGAEAARGELATKLSSTVGPEAAKTLQGVIAGSQHKSSGVLALVIGIIGSLLGASGITTQLQSSLNTILSVVPDPKGGLKRTVYVKLKNISLVILGCILIVASLIISAIVSGLSEHVSSVIGIPSFALELMNGLLSLLVFVGLIYFVYRTVPDIRIPRGIALSAAVVVSLLFIVGKTILGIIIGRNGTAGAYGAAASLVTLLLWIYYSGQIIFLGAEGIKIYGLIYSQDYDAKKFTLKRNTMTIDANNRTGKLVESWQRGFKKGQARKSKKR